MSTPYSKRFPQGSRVRIAGRPILERFKSEWRHHDPLVEAQLGYAGRVATVSSVGYYHGGDILYTLIDVPGIWHEGCLESASEAARRPRPWLAALLSFLHPVLGRVYLWDLRGAIGMWIGWTAASTVLLMVAADVTGAAPLGFAVTMWIAMYVAVVVVAWKRARHAAEVPRRSRATVAVTMTIALAFLTMLARIQVAWLRAHVGSTFLIPSASMAPAVLAGDMFFAAPRHAEPLRAGMLAIYNDKRREARLKRIVGLGGDTLEMRSARLYRNGALVREPFAAYTDTEFSGSVDYGFQWQTRALASGIDTLEYHPTPRTWGPLVIPPGDVFVLGDNRDDSDDSRFEGFVADSDVTAFPRNIYFSLDPDTHRPRWGRIGVRPK